HGERGVAELHGEFDVLDEVQPEPAPLLGDRVAEQAHLGGLRPQVGGDRVRRHDLVLPGDDPRPHELGDLAEDVVEHVVGDVGVAGVHAPTLDHGGRCRPIQSESVSDTRTVYVGRPTRPCPDAGRGEPDAQEPRSPSRARSIAALRPAKSWAPSWSVPFTKKVGVPDAPLRSPSSRSELTRRRCRSGSAHAFTPSLSPYAVRSASVSASWLANRMSCMAQKRSSSAAASDTMAAATAWGCTSRSGKCRKTNRSRSPYSSRSRRTTSTARPQYGHSKSPYSTRVTGASSGPRTWSRTGTGGSGPGAPPPAPFSPPSPGRAHAPPRSQASRKISQPVPAASSEPAKMPILAWVPSAGSPENARSVMNRETVKPMPETAAPPRTWPHTRFPGRTPRPSRSGIQVPRAMPA